MSQRNSNYARRADEDYATPAWVGHAIAEPLQLLLGVRDIWEPAAGAGKLVDAFRAHAFRVHGSTDDFLMRKELPYPVDAIVTNPPFGRGGRVAEAFVRHALTFPVAVVMLLRIDFDSGKTRTDLFRDNPKFFGKFVLLDRITWFEREGDAPSENHAWFVWGREQRHHWAFPWIRYARKPPCD